MHRLDKLQARPCTELILPYPWVDYRPCLLMVVILLTIANNNYADSLTTNTQSNRQYTSFYQQLHKPDYAQHRAVYNPLFLQVVGNNSTLANSRPELIIDPDLAFNYLWMQQYQSEYRHREGGAAAGKLLRMGIKTMLEVYTGHISTHDNLIENNVTGTLSNMGYRVRLSSDNIKLRLEYEF